MAPWLHSLFNQKSVVRSGVIVFVLMFSFPWANALKAQPSEYRTRGDALLCRDSSRIADGEAALRNKDERWLRETRCVVAPAGLKAVLVKQIWNELIQVRLYVDDSSYDLYTAVKYLELAK